MQPNSSGGSQQGGMGFGQQSRQQFGFGMDSANYSENPQSGMYQMNMGGNTTPGGPVPPNWGGAMMNQYQMMNPMFRGGVFGPYGYIPPAGPQNYKTKKCRHYETGRCKLAGLCNFAHGDEELRSANDK